MSSESKTRCTGTALAALVLCLIVTAGIARLAEAGSGKPRLLWKYATGGWVLALAVGHDGTIYAGNWADNSLYALGPDGALRRQFSVGHNSTSALCCNGFGALAVGNDGTIYAQSGYGDLFAFDPTGPLRWSLKRVRPLAEGPDGLYAMIGSDLYVLLPDGASQRKFAASINIFALAMGDAGTIYAGASGSSVCAFARNGTRKWNVAPGGAVSALAVGRYGVIYVGSHVAPKRIQDPVTGAINHVVGPTAPVVYALDPRSGSVIWSSQAPKGKIFALYVGGKGSVYVGSFDGNIYALDARSGTLIWRFTTGSGGWGYNPVHALALGNNGVIYAGSGPFVEAISPP